MEISITDNLASFSCAGRTVGEYVLDDPFKPHFRSLKTPAGHETTLVSPGDHRHHKGLMFALRCEDLNFWEEKPGDQCGIQKVLDTSLAEEGVGILQELLWLDENGGNETYREERRIVAKRDAKRSAFVYEWRTRREALRDHRLIKSPWSLEVPDGRKINYHGLGIRLPWMWSFQGEDCGGVEVNGAACEPMAACGQTAESVGFWGRIDGQWETTISSVSISQPSGQNFTWFVLKEGFPYLALGPSNAEELEVAKGEIFEESYAVRVEDRISD